MLGSDFQKSVIVAQFGEPGALRFGMTSRQRKVLAFIKGRIAETGAWPTHQEIAEAADIKARLGVEYTVTRLLALGVIPLTPPSSQARPHPQPDA